MEQEARGIRIGTAVTPTKSHQKTMDRNAENVWSVLAEMKAVCLMKAMDCKCCK